jgi:alanine dehydrogenase
MVVGVLKEIKTEEIRRRANIVKGKVTYKGVAEAFGLEYASIEELF